MRKLGTALLTLVFMAGLTFTAVAQDTTTDTTKQDKKAAKAEKKEQKAEKKEEKAAAKGKDMHLTGWVKTEGDKTVFVNDKDKQSWNVSNPDVLKSHDGMHVKVSAKLNEADKSITVDSVKDMRAAKQAGGKKAAKAAKS